MMRVLHDWQTILEVAVILAVIAGGYLWFVSKIFIVLTRPRPPVRSTHPQHTDDAIRRTLRREFRRF